MLRRRMQLVTRRSLITGPRFTPIVQRLPSIVPFVAPEEVERVRGRPFVARLGANELTLGPSSKSLEAMREACAESWKYGDPKSYELRSELAQRHNCTMDNIVVGEGIDGLLNVTAGLLVGCDDAVVTTQGTYPTLNYFVAGRGGRLETVPYADDGHVDLDALSAKAHETDAKIVYVVNPDNPSGTWRSAAAIEDFLESLPPGCLLILDEAYSELCEAPLPLIADDDLRVIRLRTFSKAYGLAGTRIGYALGNVNIISQFCKIRNHFGVNKVAQAGALAALRDDEHLAKICDAVRTGRETLVQIAADHRLTCLPSATNFVTINCGRDASFARRILADLQERDVFVRMPTAKPLDGHIRVSASSPADLAVFATAFAAAIETARRGD